MNTSLYVFRGLPGAGKSYNARKLRDTLQQRGRPVYLFDPDVLLYEDGKYNYSKERFAIAETTCHLTIRELSFRYPDADIIYADVLPRREDVEYVHSHCPDKALVVVDCNISKEESSQRNIHNVQQEDLDKMSSSWEPWEDS